MKRSLFASATAALALAIGTVGAVAPAAAAPPDSDWDAAAGADVVSLSLSTLGITLADLGISTSAATAGTTLTPRASSTSANLSAEVLGLGLGVVENTEAAPPTTAPSGLDLLAANALVFNLGALTSVNEANWAADTACVTDGALSTAQTQIAGIDVLAGTVEVGAATVSSTARLAPNAGLNHGVQSVATGAIAGLSLLDDTITIDVEGATTLTATSTGTGDSITYDPAQVTVTLGGVGTVLEPGVTLPLTVGTTQVSITLNEPPTLAASSASLDFLSISIDSLLGTDVTLGVLPMSVDATAPAGGIDCPPPAPVITQPANGSTTNATPTLAGSAEPNASVEVFIDGASVGTATATGGGSWSLPLTTPLAAGAHTATATQTVGGQISPSSAPVTFTVDATAPSAPVIVSPTNGQLLNDSTPAVSGTAEANSTVTVYIDGASVGTIPADGAGNWTFTPGTPVADGAHAVYATATDAVGNVSVDSNTVNFTIDATLPSAPVIVSPANGSWHTTTPTITGSAEANSTVTVYIDGSAAGTAPADGAGNWTFAPATPLADGVHTAYTTATDAAGNVSPNSNTVSFTIDGVAPAAPVILTPTNGQVLNDTTPTITGTAEANSTVTVIIYGDPIGTTDADGAGNWTFTPTTPLVNGPHTLTAAATDAAGNTSPPSMPVIFFIDASAPAAPVIVTPTSGQVLGDNTPTITGTAEADSTVTVIIDGTPAGTTPADGAGNWTFTPAIPLPDGPHVITATATDAAGNTGAQATPVNITIDTVTPTPPIIVTPTSGQVLADNTPTITGTAEANSTILVIIDGIPVGGTSADAGGNWSYTPSSPLADGPHVVTATATDAAGNTGPQANPVEFTVDTVDPAAPVILTPADGASVNTTTPAISGTAEANSTVTVYVDGSSIGTAPVDATGNWAITPSIPLASGPHTAVATATDAAGNLSGLSNVVAFTVDTTAPAAPVTLTPTEGQLLDDSTPTITGTAEANSTILVIIDGTPVGGTTADAGGNWSYTPSSSLADGPHVVTATATDAAGNTSPPATPVNFAIDATPPPAPVITSPTDGETIDDGTPEITGTAEPGSTVTVMIDGEPAGTTTTDENGNWTLTPSAPLGNGDHTITATATDAVGNTGPQAEPITVTVDVPGPPDLQFSLTPSTQTVDSGSRAVLTATVRNSGETTATDVVVTIEMPPGFTDYSGVAVEWPDSRPQPPDGAVGSLIFTVGDLAPGQAVVYRIVGAVTGQSGSTLTLSGTAVQAEPDAYAADNSAEARIMVASASALPTTGGADPAGALLPAMLLLLLGGLALAMRRRRRVS